MRDVSPFTVASAQRSADPTAEHRAWRAAYADYSHGIRLVSAMAIEDGALQLRDLLQDARLANALSDEGAIRPVVAGNTASVGEGRCGLGS